jgi:predicted DNA-binding protein YlxM (UPF0122 family)
MLKKWYIVAGMAIAAAAVLFAGGIVGGVLTGVIPAIAQEVADEGPPFGVWHGGGMGMHGHGPGGPGLDTVAEVLGMTPEDLRAQLQAGKTLAEIAEAQGVDPQAVCDALHALAEERLQQAVADGQLTQEQADQMLERMAEHEGDCLLDAGSPFGMRHGRGMGMGWRDHGAVLDTAAEVLGMTPEDLQTELQTGKSLAEIAEAQNVDPQAVCDAIHAQAEEMVQQAVADGHLTQEQADSILERMAEREGDCLSMTGKPLGFGRAGGRPWGGFGGRIGCPHEE